MEGLIWLILWAAMGFVCMKIAEKKSRKQPLWFILGLVFGFFALIVITLLPPA